MTIWLTSELAGERSARLAPPWQVRVVLVAALLAPFWVTSTASAWSYTIDAPITIDATNNNGSGVFGTINRVNGHFLKSAPTGASAAGSVNTGMDVDKTLQDFVWFSITLDAGSVAIDQMTASIGPSSLPGPPADWVMNPVGAGFDVGSGDQEPNDSVVAGPPFSDPSLAVNNAAIRAEYNFEFGNLNAENLEGGETSADLLWVGELIFSGTGQGVIADNVISFMISTAGSANVFDVAGTVPEPGTGLLLSSGLVGIALKRRREAQARRTASKA